MTGRALSFGAVAAAYERFRPGYPDELVFVASALHWTEREGRWERVARLLAPGGRFASFGGQVGLADAALEDAVHEAQSPWLADDARLA